MMENPNRNFSLNLGGLNDNNFKIIIATHSTAILGALESYNDTHFAFVTFDQKTIEFNAVSAIYKKILPVFGAHPLSNIFNKAPILLVEGEDDERVWQQVVRSSAGRIQIYPCSVESVTNMNDFEKESQKIIQTVYDDATGYSLRDRDDTDGELEDLLPINELMKFELIDSAIVTLGLARCLPLFDVIRPR